MRDLVEKMLKSSGRRVDLSAPFVDAMLPDGSRLHVVIPDITRRFWSVNIRKFVVRASHLDDLVALGSLTPAAARFLDAAVRSGLNVLVSGGTQAGKTTLLNCLAAAIPPQERVVTVRGGLRAEDPVARRRVAAVPAAEPRGHRRDQAAPAGQGGAADAPVAHHRRRGPPGGEPRPADRRSTPGLPGMCQHPRQLGPRGGHQAVHAAVAGRGQRHAQVRRADRRGLHRPGGAHQHRGRRSARGPRGAGDPGSGRGRRGRGGRGVRDARRAAWYAPMAGRRTSNDSPVPASTWPTLLAGAPMALH